MKTLFERPQDKGKINISKIILANGKEIDFAQNAYFLVFDEKVVYGENEFGMSFGFNNQEEAMCLSESATMFSKVIQLMAKYDIDVKSAFEKIFKREREKSTPKDYTLEPGQYTIGKDVNPGIYDIKCINGSGVVYCEDNGFSDMLNLMMSSKKEEYYIISYKNAKLNDKAILFVDELTIELRGK